MTGTVRTTAASIAVLTAALTGGCASQQHSVTTGGDQPPVFMIDEHANNTTVKVVEGATVKLELHSTYWANFGSSQPAVVREVGGPAVLPTTTQCVPGGGCAPVLATFTAVRAGTSVLSASRTSCGEALRCGPAASHYRVTILVVGPQA